MTIKVELSEEVMGLNAKIVRILQRQYSVGPEMIDAVNKTINLAWFDGRANGLNAVKELIKRNEVNTQQT